MQDKLKENGAELDCRSGAGYLLIVNDEAKLDNYIKACAYDNQTDQMIPLFEQRAHLIVRYLLCQKEYSRIEDLESLMYLNRTTVLNDYNNAKEILAGFAIEVKTRSKHGLYIDGREADIRACLNCENYYYQRCQLQLAEDYGTLYQMPEETMYALQQIVLENVDAYSRNDLSDTEIASLASSIYIMGQRNRQGYRLSYDDDVQDRFLARNSYYTAKIITKKAAELLKTAFYTCDDIYIAIFIIANRNMLQPSDFPLRENYLTCREMAFAVSNYLHDINDFDYIGKDMELIDTISMNLLQISMRMEFHLHTNYRLSGLPLGLMARKLAIQSAVFLEEQYKIKLDADEIYKLACLIHPVFGRYPFSFRSAKALVVSQVNKSVAKGMAERLQRNFGGKIQDFVPCNIYELHNLDLSHYDFVFTSVPSQTLPIMPSNITVINTDVFFSEKEKQQIRWTIVQHIASKGISNHVYMNEGISIENGLPAKNKDEVFRYIASYVEARSATKKGVYDSLLKSERYFQSMDLNNVVYLTPLEGHTAKVFVGIFILKKAIQWKLHKAQIIVYWDRGLVTSEANNFENESLPHLINITVSDETVTKMLLDGMDLEQLKKYLRQYNEQILLNGRSFN